MLIYNKSKFRVFLALFLASVVAIFAFMNNDKVFRAVRYIDKNYLSESLKDMRAQVMDDEDWSSIEVVGDYDYRWLEAESGLVRIAHGLGGEKNSNTFSAFQNARVNGGFSVFEVDLWLDKENIVRCHHGPDEPAALDDNDCTFDRLIARLVAHEYLVLDIKTDFFKTATEILKFLKSEDKANRIIFQLYKPEHLRKFAHWSKTYSLAGPIVTAYNSSRSLNHIFRAIEPAGIRAFTFPIARAPSVTRKKNGVSFFVHPVKNCNDMKQVHMRAFNGIYVRRRLFCEQSKAG